MSEYDTDYYTDIAIYEIHPHKKTAGTIPSFTSNQECTKLPACLGEPS